MSSPEQLNTNNESRQGLFGPAEFVQYATESEEVQLAERYSRRDTHIDWGDYSHTANPNRRAFITDADDNMYYLRGDVLYDLGASVQNRQLMGFKYRDVSAIPRLTIGEGAPFSQAAITEVIIGFGRAHPEDSLVQDARPETEENPFYRWEIILSGLPQRDIVPPPPRPIRPEDGFMTDEGGELVVPLARHPRTFRHGPGLPEDPEARAEVTRLSGWLAKLDLSIARPKSRDGKPISPRPAVKPLDTSSATYEGKDEKYKRFVGKSLANVPEEDREEFMEAIIKEHTREVRDDRYKIYRPRLGSRIRYALFGGDKS